MPGGGGIVDILDDRVRVEYYDGAVRQVHIDASAAERSMSVHYRSRELLKRHLTPEQAWMLEHEEYFTVKGKSGTTYEIRSMSSGNVWSDDGFAYCAVLPGCPTFDMMLAQKLVIEHNENEFLRVAVRSERRDGPWCATYVRRRQRAARRRDRAMIAWVALFIVGTATLCYGFAQACQFLMWVLRMGR